MLQTSVSECVHLVSHCSACECAWRLFSTTQGAVLTLHVTQTDLWAFYTALSCAAGYSLCVYILKCVNMTVSCAVHVFSVHVCVCECSYISENKCLCFSTNV